MKSTQKIEKMRDQLQEWKDYFEDMSEKRQDKYDNASDNWQESDKGDTCLEEVDQLSDIAIELDTVISTIEMAYEL